MSSDASGRMARTRAWRKPQDIRELIEQTRELIEEARELRATVKRILAEEPSWSVEASPRPAPEDAPPGVIRGPRETH